MNRQTFVQRIGAVWQAIMLAFGNPLPKQPQNRYESAYQLWGDRSLIPASINDARFDASASTRLELVRRSRYWERNSAFVQRLIDVFECYVVGATGLKLIPNSQDEDWNQVAAAWWAGWCRFPDMVSLQEFGTLQQLMARTWFVDGEVFVHKTYSSETGKPRIQLIEGHRVQTPGDLSHLEGTQIIDGVQINKAGRPVAYWVRKSDTSTPGADSVAGLANYQNGIAGIPVTGPSINQFEQVPADQIIHIFEPARPGMYRGLPFLYPCMNDLHALDDLQVLEGKAAAVAAENAIVVTTKTGEPRNTASFRRQNQQIQSQNAQGTPVNKSNLLAYDVSVGGRKIFQMPGESITEFKSERPTVAVMGYWNYLLSKICLGVGIPLMMVMPYALQGTAIRADLEIASAFFRSRSHVIATACREIYTFAMGWGVKFDRSLDRAPADWAAVTIRPPRSVNVDFGRQSAAIIAELQAGTRTFADACGELGHDWREVIEQRGKECAHIDKVAAKYGVDRDRISNFGQPTTPSPEFVPVKLPAKKTEQNGHNGHGTNGKRFEFA